MTAASRRDSSATGCEEGPKGRTSWLKLPACLAALLIAAALAACDNPTATPSPTAPPTSAPETAIDSPEQVAAYAQECGSALSSFAQMSPRSLAESGEDVAYGDLSKALEGGVRALGQVEPPPELRAYHDARLRFFKAHQDHARSRPGTQSAVEDYLIFNTGHQALEFLDVATVRRIARPRYPQRASQDDGGTRPAPK